MTLDFYFAILKLPYSKEGENMITIKKEMIKVSESKNFLNDDYDGFIFGLTDLTVYIKEIDRFIDVDVYSSIKIDQQEIIKDAKFERFKI
ncbi:hypothetical protein [Delftia tsuruhatensis]|uniref:hypothetical protein n=1 Tax=Delftia tsuruhatensis TaxID=180282 RepID=UPI003A87FFEA